ncbi:MULTISPECIES: asparaginase [Streptomyces]|uniref:L-asparaginase n=2 Tax=Streptomyces venezuelae TaxID=54571 RepID=F2RGX2_STRVP|nr:asparaginase [Streptomyces venezuelae]APE20974.1 L-asparaginase [Streptomyces venezuelae]QER98369.1 asparaginase [Streptomyces venezuelae ATCC 10712]QES15695.1 asparaginase [Streptomyces venezuelae]CCA54933.1 L-asparaginase [Streptomyces venezuelae ATCC 10712]
MARVTVFTLGGTISARGGDAARMSGQEVLAELGGDHDIVLNDFRRVPSSTLTHADLAALAAEIRATVAAGSGVVVVQGTDTLEETAFLLDLLCTTEQPIAVTGAMRRPDLPGADGPANLAAALAVAADPACRDLGVLVVLADEIHAARLARKSHTTSVATFTSPGAGPLGTVVEGEPRILFRPAVPAAACPLKLDPEVRVALVTLSLGDRGELLDAVDDRFQGLVVAAFGAGHAPGWLVEPLAEIARRIPVVLASRTGGGATLTDTYRSPGSEYDLLHHGLIPAGPLDPAKARILLHTLLSSGAAGPAGYDRPRITAAFTHLNGSGLA